MALKVDSKPSSEECSILPSRCGDLELETVIDSNKWWPGPEMIPCKERAGLDSAGSFSQISRQKCVLSLGRPQTFLPPAAARGVAQAPGYLICR